MNIYKKHSLILLMLFAFNNSIFAYGEEIIFQRVVDNSEIIAHLRIDSSKVNYFMFGGADRSCGIKYSAKIKQLFKGATDNSTITFHSHNKLNSGEEYILFLSSTNAKGEHSSNTEYDISLKECEKELPSMKTQYPISFKQFTFNKGHQHTNSELWAKYESDMIIFPETVTIKFIYSKDCSNEIAKECFLMRKIPIIKWNDIINIILKK